MDADILKVRIPDIMEYIIDNILYICLKMINRITYVIIV